MGNQTSKLSTQEKLSPEFREMYSCRGTYENMFDGSKIQKCWMDVSDRNIIEYEKNIFIFRKMHSDKLITAYYFSDLNQQYLCSSMSRICYFVELPRSRLSSFASVAFDRGLQILVESLQGYDILYKKFGYFKVTPDSICFDIHNKVKVWIDGNLAETRLKKYEKKSQFFMIKEIFQMMNQRRDLNESNLEYSDFLKNITFLTKKQITFEEVITFLISEIPKYLNGKSNSLFQKQKNKVKKPYLKKDKQNNPHVKSLKNRKASQQNYQKQSAKCVKYRLSQNVQEKQKRTKRYNSQEMETNPSGFSIKTSLSKQLGSFNLKKEVSYNPNHSPKIEFADVRQRQKKMVTCDNLRDERKTEYQMHSVMNKNIQKIESKYLRQFTQTNIQNSRNQRETFKIKEEEPSEINIKTDDINISAQKKVIGKESQLLQNLKTVKSILGTENFNNDFLDLNDIDDKLLEVVNLKKINLKRAISQPPPPQKKNKNK